MSSSIIVITHAMLSNIAKKDRINPPPTHKNDKSKQVSKLEAWEEVLPCDLHSREPHQKWRGKKKKIKNDDERKRKGKKGKVKKEVSIQLPPNP